MARDSPVRQRSSSTHSLPRTMPYERLREHITLKAGSAIRTGFGVISRARICSKRKLEDCQE